MFYIDRYGPGDGYADAYGSSPHSHHYDSSPPFQTVPNNGVQTPEHHWSSPNNNGVTSTTTGSSGSGTNTPVDIQLGNQHPHMPPHPAYINSHHRDPYATSHHHSHSLSNNNGDIKPVIPSAMLGGYTGMDSSFIVVISNSINKYFYFKFVI